MRVLFLNNIPSPYRVDFFDELGKSCELTVLFERDQASDRDKRWKSKTSSYYNAVFLKGKKLGADGAFCPGVISWLDKRKFDIFVIGCYSTPTSMLAIEVLKLKNIPFVLNADGGFLKKDSKFKYMLKKHFISSAKWWLSTGKSTTQYLCHYGANKENTFTYPFTSIWEKEVLKKHLTKEEKLAIRRELGINGKKVAISVGQLIHRKGYDLLLRAWEKVDKEFELLIIGSGEDKESLEKLKEEKEIHSITFIDFKTKEELKKYYLAADIFILPTREDIWGLVVNEAMAYALPVITTDRCIAGLELINQGENGYLLKIDELQHLSSYVEAILENEKALYQIAQNNLEKIKEYTIENMAKEHLDFLKKVTIQEEKNENTGNRTYRKR